MTTTIQITQTGSDSYAFTITIYNVSGGLGYISFSCNDSAFFEYFRSNDVLLFVFVDCTNIETLVFEKAVQYWDAEGTTIIEPMQPSVMAKIINANPQVIAKAIYQKITGQMYPGGDVSVIFPNNQ